ncbi:MAG: ABC transporter substrate-binding protein [Flexilinea sp.]
MKKVLVAVLLVSVLVFALGAFSSVNAADVDKSTFKVGFSELNVDDAWRIAQVESMDKFSAENGYTDYIMTNAEYDTSKQISDVEDLISQGVDFLFIAPIDMDAIVPALQEAKEAKIPVILLDRQATGTWGEDWITTIIADYIEQAKMAASWIIDNMDMTQDIKVAEIMGTVGGSDVRDRAAGFREVVDQYENIEITYSQSGEWNRATTQDLVANLLQSTGGDIDVIYCHNDEMALGAVLAVKAYGLKPGEDIKIIGIDGQKEAVQAIIDGEINAIATCNPRSGETAFKALNDYLDGKTFEEFIIMQETLITKDNAAEKLADAF